MLLFAGLRALRARDASGMLLATGVASTLAFQSIVNVGNGDLTHAGHRDLAPFISQGASSLISICFALAMRAGAEASALALTQRRLDEGEFDRRDFQVGERLHCDEPRIADPYVSAGRLSSRERFAAYTIHRESG